MKLGNILYAALANKCPRCHNGQVFENNNAYNFKNGLTMNKHCPHCGLKFEREVGYFYGAMYVSYGIQVVMFLSLFTLSALWLHLQPLTLVLSVIGVVIPLFPLTFRWSRIAWISFFTPFNYQT